MTFVITKGCCNDAACIAVCPVQCIRPRPGDPDFTTAEQLYIDPDTCIDCSACEPVCPVDAIVADYDVDDADEVYLGINADYFVDHPIEPEEPVATPRRRLPDGVGELRVAIVGTGPSACYTAAELLRTPGVRVTMLDRLPTPLGLIRSGVAADHPRTKQAGAPFRRLLSRPEVTCLLNVEVGRDVGVDELLDHHHAVVWAAGAQGDRRLGIPGEDLAGSMSAREVVAWYNGHPDHHDRGPDLSGERVVVIGNGNVALDVARTIALPAAALATTDLADHALDALRSSAVREVVVAARRGPLDAAFSLSEALAMAELDGVALTARPDEVEIDVPGSSALERRKLDVVRAAAARTGDTDRAVVLRFGLTPVSIEGEGSVSAVTFATSRPVVEDGVTVMRPTGEHETIETSTVLRAIGYRSLPVDGVPFDDERGTVANTAGRITDEHGGVVPGLYCVGWAKRGATGVIGTNKADALETVTALLDDVDTQGVAEPPRAVDELVDTLRARCPDLVDHAGWAAIDAAELAAGRAAGRPRVKLVTVDALLEASRTRG